MLKKQPGDIIQCTHCGTLNRVTIRYSDFGPANQERETGECISCGHEIISKKCLGISVEKVDNENP